MPSDKRLVLLAVPALLVFLGTGPAQDAVRPPAEARDARVLDLRAPAPRAVVAPRAMVASAHPLASRAGLDMMRAGGNAIDALVATQMVLNVVEPGNSGIGGGCFIVYHDAGTRQTYCIDGREEVPAQSRREDFLDAGGKVKRDAKTGGQSVGVPGTVAAMWLAHGRWGKLPIARVLEPAVRLAEDGTGVTRHFRRSIVDNRDRLAHFPGSRAAFFPADGSVPELGEVVRQPDLARTLCLLIREGPKAFYEGEIAADVVKAVREAPYQPGRMSADDLRNYRAVYREPVRLRYRGYEILTMPPPSSGGITLGMILAILEGADWNTAPAGSLAEIERLARAGATAFANRDAYLGDADWNPEIDMNALLEPSFLQDLARTARGLTPGEVVAPGRLPGRSGEKARQGGADEGQETTHISIVDGDRNLVACTTTIESWMGSGVVVGGRGFLLNNELTDFDLDQAAGPNALDVTRRPRRTALGDNQQPAGKRPRSSMTPVLVLKEGRPYLTLGSPGGSYIIGVVAQVLHNLVDYDLNVQEALNAPRVSDQNRPVELEWLYPNRRELLEALRARGWKVREPPRPDARYHGNAHGIRVRPDGQLEGGADPRIEGAARGF